MNDQKMILAIETALREPSVSLLRGADEIGHWCGAAQISSSASLLPAISTLLKANQLSIKDLDIIAVSQGPGSFTGIRVGLATAAALALGSKKKCCGVSLLEAFAVMPALQEKTPENTGNKTITAIAAGNNQLYWQAFSSDAVRSESEFQLDDYADFTEKVDSCSAQENSNITIVAEQRIAMELENSFFDKGNIKVAVASDNVGRFVGLRLVNLLKEKSIDQLGLLELTPFYIKDVRIGR